MAISKATWETLEAKIISDWSSGVHVQSYNVAGQDFGYASLDQQRKLLNYVQGKIAQLTPGSTNGFFQLYRDAGI